MDNNNFIDEIKLLFPTPQEPYIAIKLFFDNNLSFASRFKNSVIAIALP
ncbi:MAG: hypothetical protein RR201_02930 [Malacoplasma sp.]